MLSDAFLARVAAELSFAEAPLYALVHEACYAQGTATRWAADRIMAEFPEFDPAAAVDGDITFLFTGEMIYPWMFETDPVLRPLRDAAEELAQRESWPRLYDPARLAASDVPAAAAVYYEDMYVPLALSVPTARRDPRPAALDHERVPARRAGQQQRRGAGPAHRAGPGHGLTPLPDGAPADPVRQDLARISSCDQATDAR